MLNHPIPGEKPSLPFIKSFYVREWVRFIHSHLDMSTSRFLVFFKILKSIILLFVFYIQAKYIQTEDHYSV